MTISVRTVFLIGLSSLIGLMSAPARAETLLIVADPWCPYNCAPDSTKPGMIVEIVKKAFERHGISVTYETLPWTRAVEETRAFSDFFAVGSIALQLRRCAAAGQGDNLFDAQGALAKHDRIRLMCRHLHSRTGRN